MTAANQAMRQAKDLHPGDRTWEGPTVRTITTVDGPRPDTGEVLITYTDDTLTICAGTKLIPTERTPR